MPILSILSYLTFSEDEVSSFENFTKQLMWYPPSSATRSLVLLILPKTSNAQESLAVVLMRSLHSFSSAGLASRDVIFRICLFRAKIVN